MTTTVGQRSRLRCQNLAENRFGVPRISMEATVNEINDTFEKLWIALAPYLSPDMAEFILSAPDSNLNLHGKKQEISVLFADIRGFMALAEQVEPEDCLQILNEYFRLAVDEIIACEGTVDKFQGDCVMATFGSIPGGPGHEYRAVHCAVRLREAVRCLRIPQIPEQRIRLGIGVNTGVAIVGSVGSSKRMDYTAVGDVVNVAHRLQTLSEPDQILIGQSTRRRIGGALKVENLGPLQLRGRIEPINAYAVQQLNVVN